MSEPKTLYSKQEGMDDAKIVDNHNDNNQPWLLQDALAIIGRKHCDVGEPKGWELYSLLNLELLSNLPQN